MTPPPTPPPEDLEPAPDHRADLVVFALVTVAVQSYFMGVLEPPIARAGDRYFPPLFASLFGLTQIVYVGPMTLLAALFQRPYTATYWVGCAAVVFLLNGLYCVAGGPW